MPISWKDYEIIDTSGGEKLERWGDVLLIRPDPQIIWNTPKTHPAWKKADARYIRSNAGGGSWQNRTLDRKEWKIRYGGLTFKVKPTGFKHTGLFPEQAVNWDFMAQKDPGGEPAGEGAQPVCVHWGRHAGLC